MRLETTPDLHAGTTDALVAYMTDCRFTEAHLTWGCLFLAAEYVYQPRPRFWQDFDLTYFVNAMTRCIPNWRIAVEGANRSVDVLLQDIEEFLHCNAFDEANAEMMLALPAHERPTDATSAFDWLSAQSARNGLKSKLEFAKHDGDACGEHALVVLHCLEEAAAGRTVDRVGTIVARGYRDDIMSGRIPDDTEASDDED
ncbi:hypothetical protein WK60_31055 [Burkholderia ubonensis]|uniref:hypothetical protein n=1 Tax=Burkholderia ubonensis TaxID=101571 RepID=UPI0007589E57|nr:hypothetical protein [Burkholderia ubonensis]KVU02575.1 hypothetical protein WK60_31055 [Burkholderia ubonensis]